MDFPKGSVVKVSACKAGDTGDKVSVPGWGRSPGAGYGNPLQYSCLENFMDRGAWRATVHRVTKSQIRLKQLIAQSSGSLSRCVHVGGLKGILGTHPAEGNFLMPVRTGRGASRTKAGAGMPL